MGSASIAARAAGAVALPRPSSPSLLPPNPNLSSPLTSKNFTFLNVSLDDLYFLVDYLVAHLLLVVNLDIYAHNSTSPCGIFFATRPRYHRAPVTFTFKLRERANEREWERARKFVH